MTAPAVLTVEQRLIAPRTRHPLYSIWSGMLQRCNNPNCKGYRNYGGRGITVCTRWRESFEAFASDVGARPSTEHTLDRINVNGNYEPTNVRWATDSEQQRNRRDNVRTLYQGELLTAQDIAERVGLPANTIRTRLSKGVTGEALVEPGELVKAHRVARYPQRKTHCKRGHALAGENVYIHPDGIIECRACRAARDLKRTERRQAARAAQ